jgi:hypothetical protein
MRIRSTRISSRLTDAGWSYRMNDRGWIIYHVSRTGRWYAREDALAILDEQRDLSRVRYIAVNEAVVLQGGSVPRSLLR